jgi:hypothetical protein
LEVVADTNLVAGETNLRVTTFVYDFKPGDASGLFRQVTPRTVCTQGSFCASSARTRPAAAFRLLLTIADKVASIALHQNVPARVTVMMGC